MPTYTNAPIHQWELSSPSSDSAYFPPRESLSNYSSSSSLPSLLRERPSRSTYHASTDSLSLSSFYSAASDCPRIPCELEGDLPNNHVRTARYYEVKKLFLTHFSASSFGSESDKTTSHGWTDTCPHVDTRFSVNPRRTSAVRSGGPPSLIRQGDRKGAFVENLVENATRIVEAIWPTSSSTNCRTQAGSSNSGMLSLFTFVQETLRRSRTSYSTLQVALYYLVLIKPHVPPPNAVIEQQTDGCLLALRALQCGRRMFLTALILASKYLQDRNYSARAWSKISGLPVDEINQNEMAFLNAVRWKLHIAEEAYQRWAEVTMKHMSSSSHSRPPSPSGESAAASHTRESRSDSFKQLIVALNPDLDNLDELLRVETSWPPLCTPVARAESLSPVSLFMPSGERSFMAGSDYRIPRVLRPSLSMPAVLEPEPVTANEPHLMAAPALGLLPTPRLTPVGAGFNTPAASFASSLPPHNLCASVTRRQAGGFAPTLSRSDCAHPPPPPTLSHTTSPPSPQFFSRRPSLAISAASIVSSPESLVSDSSSVFSFSSTVSSAASSVASAPIFSLDDPARARYWKQWGDGMGLRNKGLTSHRSFECGLQASSSPLGPAEESAYGAAGRSVHEWNGSGCDRRVRGMTRNAHSFVQLPRQSYFRFESSTTTTAGAAHSVPPKAGLKRPSSIANLVQDNVRDLLRERYPVDGTWSEAMLRAPPPRRPEHPLACDSVDEGRKRVCFSPGTLPSCVLVSPQPMSSVCHVG